MTKICPVCGRSYTERQKRRRKMDTYWAYRHFEYSAYWHWDVGDRKKAPAREEGE